MNLKQIYRIARHLSYDEFESHYIEIMTGKAIIIPIANEPVKSNENIIAAQKAYNYARLRFGIEFFDETSKDVNDCIKDYYKGFMAGFNHKT
jgi:hypothetical protein